VHFFRKVDSSKFNMQKINVIIPVFNESGSIGHVLKDIPANLVTEVIVVNNGSTDNTAEIAQNNGCHCVYWKKERVTGRLV
jgi:glycosyltransferase involved in cell wall biosynthesis